VWDRNGSTSGPTPWQLHDDDDDYEYRVRVLWLDSSGLGQGLVLGICKHDNEPSGSTRAQNVLTSYAHYQRPKNSSPWILLFLNKLVYRNLHYRSKLNSFRHVHVLYSTSITLTLCSVIIIALCVSSHALFSCTYILSKPEKWLPNLPPQHRMQKW
jgi:hypothetical protein